jgi:predicted transcriptional regulator
MKPMTPDDLVADPIDDEMRVAILEGLAQARRGEFVPDKEIEALWKRHGVFCAEMKR